MESDIKLVEVLNICKSFEGVNALNHVKFDLRRGEVHALLGENGAGKSTLIKIICGAINFDSGELKINGEKVSKNNPLIARKLGVSTVFQELSLIEELTVEENIFLGHEPSRMMFLNKNRRTNEAKRILSYLGSSLNLNTKIKELGAAQQQIVEIAKALSTNPRIIIFDEPTDKLYGDEQEQLFKVIKYLKDSGKGIIYITHKLEEISVIADRVTILRDGSYVNTYASDAITDEEIIKNMVGRELTSIYPKENIEIGEVGFRVEKLNYKGYLCNINLDVKKGEILGMGGLVGSGRTFLAQNLAGIVECTSGKIFLDDVEVDISTPIRAIKNGIVYLPEDRKTNGLVMLMNIFDNIILPSLNKLILNKKELGKSTSRLVSKLKIKAINDKTVVSNLSGGNQQKVVIAKWLNTNAKVYIFDEPTQGIDVGTKAEIYKLMNELARNGACIIMISSDMRELIAMSDRVAIMKEGKISAILPKGLCTQENILGKALI